LQMGQVRRRVVSQGVLWGNVSVWILLCLGWRSDDDVHAFRVKLVAAG
jgi:hypothetical protein